MRAFGMPVRSLSSSVLRWPDAQTVDRAVRGWAEKVVRRREDVLRIGYFGSYARGDWGVGSDVDLVIVVDSSEALFERRSVEFDASTLPVPADVLVYTREEWRTLSQQGRFRNASREAVWVYRRDEAEGLP
jgi:predicted nucleotidyltransferase